MSEEQFAKAYNVPPETEKDWQRFFEDKKSAFQFLRKVYHADPESMLKKKTFSGESTPRYDLYREGVKPADVSGQVFTEFEKTLRQSLERANQLISREMILSAISAEITEQLIAEGYDMDKVIDFEISTYNKYRNNWFSAVHGDAQLLIEELEEDDVKKEFTRKIRALLTKNRLIYGKSLEEASSEQEVAAMKAERADFIKDVDAFLDELIVYCDGRAGV